MKRILKRIAVLSGIVSIGIGFCLFFAYQAATATNPKYELLLSQSFVQLETGELETRRQELESQLAALYSEAQRETGWASVLTQTQLNSWFATQLSVDLPELAELGITVPRILLETEQVTLLMQADVAGVQSVVSVVFEPYVVQYGAVALEFKQATAGRMPIPLASVLDWLRAATQEQKIPGRWTRSSGHPTLLIDLEDVLSSESQVCRLEHIELREGEVYFSGMTTPAAPRIALETGESKQ